MARGSVAVVPELGLATGADQLGGRSLRKRIVVAVVMLAFGCAAVALAAASASGDSKLRDTSVLKVGVSDRLDVWRQYQNDEDINPRKKKGAKADWEKQRSIPDFVDGIIGPSPTAMDEGGSKSRGSFNVKKITDKTDFYYLRITDRSGNNDRIRAELVGSDGYRLDWVGFGEIFTGPIHEGNLGETDYLRVEVRFAFLFLVLFRVILHIFLRTSRLVFNAPPACAALSPISQQFYTTSLFDVLVLIFPCRILSPARSNSFASDFKHILSDVFGMRPKYSSDFLNYPLKSIRKCLVPAFLRLSFALN
jgi:hypothetical protein